MPKASTFTPHTASQMVDSDAFPFMPNAGGNGKISVSELRDAVGLGWGLTINAARFAGISDELKIQAAIDHAVNITAPRVFVPTAMLPYDASAVTFSPLVQMVREGGSFDVYDVKAYGAAGDGLTNDYASFQAVVDNAPDYSTIVYPGSLDSYLIDGAIVLDDRAGLTFLCYGATIQLSGTDSQALQFSNLNDDIAVHGLRVIGSGVVGDNHEGFGTVVGTPVGTGGDNIKFYNCHVKDCARGYHFESSVATVWRDLGWYGCRASNIVGTGSGTGYGILFGSVFGVTVEGCYLDQCQRHSVYCSNSHDVSIIGTKFRRHRDTVYTNGFFSALVVCRRPDVNVLGCSFDECADTALEISSDESDVNEPMYNINIIGNHFHGSVHRDVLIGSTAAATSGALSNVNFIGNSIMRADDLTGAAPYIESLLMFNGKGVSITNNKWHLDTSDGVGYAAQKACIVLGSGSIAASYIDQLKIKDNRCFINQASFGAYFLELTTNICTGSSDIEICDNYFDKGAASGALIAYDATRTSTTIRVSGNNYPDPQTTVVGPDLLGQRDLNFSGGYRQVIDAWYQDAAAASQTNAPIGKNYGGAGFGTQWIALRAGSITGIQVKSSQARTAGTLTVEVFRNGATGLTAVLDGTNTLQKSTIQAKDLDTFVAGDAIDVRVTTTAGWLPVSAQITASVEIET